MQKKIGLAQNLALVKNPQILSNKAWSHSYKGLLPTRYITLLFYRITVFGRGCITLGLLKVSHNPCITLYKLIEFLLFCQDLFLSSIALVFMWPHSLISSKGFRLNTGKWSHSASGTKRVSLTRGNCNLHSKIFHWYITFESTCCVEKIGVLTHTTVKPSFKIFVFKHLSSSTNVGT